MDLLESKLEGEYIAPDGTLKPYASLRRIDPITGHAARITGPRVSDSPPGPRTLPDITPEVERTRNCPFCEGNVEVKTPKFVPQIHPDGRFRRGTSVLFPNISPYGRYSAVCIFSTDHHVPLGDFSTRQYCDALGNCVDYSCVLTRVDPDESRFHLVSQNILPSSGGALLHPHLQVNVDRHAMNYHRLLHQAEEREAEAGRGSLLLDLASTEERLGCRVVGAWGDWLFFTAFAPLANWEVHAVSRGARKLDELSGRTLDDLVRGMLAVHCFWKMSGRNAANMGLFATADGAHPLFARMMVRSAYRQWYRSDRSAYEVACVENATDANPEVLAARMRDALRPKQ